MVRYRGGRQLHRRRDLLHGKAAISDQGENPDPALVRQGLEKCNDIHHTEPTNSNSTAIESDYMGRGARCQWQSRSTRLSPGTPGKWGGCSLWEREHPCPSRLGSPPWEREHLARPRERIRQAAVTGDMATLVTVYVVPGADAPVRARCSRSQGKCSRSQAGVCGTTPGYIVDRLPKVRPCHTRRTRL